jgi:hypothetical protein
MSALGQKRTLGHVRVMSALPPKADIDQHGRMSGMRGHLRREADQFVNDERKSPSDCCDRRHKTGCTSPPCSAHCNPIMRVIRHRAEWPIFRGDRSHPHTSHQMAPRGVSVRGQNGRDVRFAPNSGHGSARLRCPFCAKSRHWPVAAAAISGIDSSARHAPRDDGQAHQNRKPPGPVLNL